MTLTYSEKEHKYAEYNLDPKCLSPGVSVPVFSLSDTSDRLRSYRLRNGDEMISHYHNFKNMILDFPKEILEWILPDIPAKMGEIRNEGSQMSSKILHHPEIGHIHSRWPTHKPCGVPLLATCHNSAGKNLNIECHEKDEGKRR
jgi:hypothetical protein